MTIRLEVDQPMATDPDWAVAVAGDYAPEELVLLYRVSDQMQEVRQMAQYVFDGTFPS